MIKQRFYQSLVELTQNPLYTKILRMFTASKLSRILNSSFVDFYKINKEEMELDIKEYKTINELFARKLKEGSRPVASEKEIIASPVDGVLSKAGIITEDAAFHVKGKDYSLSKMVGLENTRKRYTGGYYMLFYLSPKDYHRIHSPLNGFITKRWALGKYSDPVNQLGLMFGKDPLSNNYRIITEFENENSIRMAMVKIGALNVNSIHPTHLEGDVKTGQEVAYFSFGSTVILLFEADTVEPLTDWNEENVVVKQGQTLGRFRVLEE
ncbi:phosphatidylserine decarboxylase [Evansella clarkii]|uniref:phosphatidylserine decarboxylase n=1 Tax=Evansella clarkii TaxID=79879 RepID=UPI000B431F64|nr:phosphatidylserine decarboxylase [Evansella clarkii]